MQKEDFTLCKSPLSFNLKFRFLVIRLGFEPKTPTLKVLCSTN